MFMCDHAHRSQLNVQIDYIICGDDFYFYFCGDKYRNSAAEFLYNAEEKETTSDTHK